MADFVWAAAVPGNTSVGGNWKVGGVAQAAPPTAADRALFGTGTGATNVNATINAGLACRDFIVDPAFTATITGTNAVTLTVGDGTSGILTLHAGFTWTPGGGSFSVTFAATTDNGGAGWLITSGGKTLTGAAGTLAFNGNGGRWKQADTMAANIISSANTNTLDANSQTITCARFNPGNTTACLNLAAVNCSSTANGVTLFNLPTSATVSGAAVVTVTSATANTRVVILNGKTITTLAYVVAASTGQLTINGGGGSIGTLNATDATSARALGFTAGSSVTIGVWGVNGAAGRVATVVSTIAGTASTITLSTPQLCDYVSFKDITAAGGTRLLTDGIHYTNVSGNTNINFVDAFVVDTDDPTVADAGEQVNLADSDDPVVTEGDTPASAATSDSDDPTIADLDAGVGVTLSDSDDPVTDDEWAALTATLSDIEDVTIVDAIIAAAFASSESITITESLGLVIVIPVTPPFTPPGVTTDDLLGLINVGQRGESVRFELLDAALNHVADLHPIRTSAIEIANDTSQDVKRSMSGLLIDHDEQGQIDEFVHRIRPVWVLENGATFPLGVFLFGDASRARTTKGLDLHGQLVDQCYILNQSDGVVVGYSAGTSIAAALRVEFGAAGITAFAVDDSSVLLSAPIAWPADATRLERMKALCALGGYSDPYFDNLGVGRCVIIPDIALIDPVLKYGEDGNMIRDTLVESNNLLTAPNRYIVMSTSASNVPVVGIYNIPDSAPHSRARRGFVVSKTINTQGVVEPGQATVVAQQEAAKDASGFAFAEFTSAPNPRHDTYDPVEYLGENYLEVGWTLALAPGGDHKHKLRRAYS